MKQPILVTGATGNTGRHVVAGLLAEGYAVRALARDPARADLPDPVDVIAGDVTRPEDVAAAAQGASAAYLVWPRTDEDAAGAHEVAAVLGEHVDRVVYLSATGADEGGVWGGVEQAIRGAVPEWTFLRVSGLAVNALAWADQVHRGTVRAPFGGIRRSLVHERDVAAVAVRALVDDGHAAASYVITGPEAISQVEQVRIIAAELGRDVVWEEQPLDEAREELAEEVGEDFADQILQFRAENVDVPEPVSADVPRVLGRPALSFRYWARDHRADFAPTHEQHLSPSSTHHSATEMDMSPKIAVIYYSSTGHVAQLARQVHDGAREAGSEVRLRRAAELAPQRVVDDDPDWYANQQATLHIPEVGHDDLLWADAYVFGTPTRYGNVSAQLKQFLDTTGGLWFEGRLANRIVSGFTSSDEVHGGQETTLTSMYQVFMHWGAIIVPLGYTDEVVSRAGGNPYGASSTHREKNPTAEELAAANYQGRRVAEVAAQFVRGAV